MGNCALSPSAPRCTQHRCSWQSSPGRLQRPRPFPAPHSPTGPAVWAASTACSTARPLTLLWELGLGDNIPQAMAGMAPWRPGGGPAHLPLFCALAEPAPPRRPQRPTPRTSHPPTAAPPTHRSQPGTAACTAPHHPLLHLPHPSTHRLAAPSLPAEPPPPQGSPQTAHALVPCPESHRRAPASGAPCPPPPAPRCTRSSLLPVALLSRTLTP